MTIDKPTIHGTALSVFDCGIVLRGKSGVGKSELALRLIDRRHKLIADDQVAISASENDNLVYISSPLSDKYFLHLKGIGFINIKKTYGAQYVCSHHELNLVIDMHNTDFNPKESLKELDFAVTSISDVSVAKADLYLSTNRPLEILVEIIVMQFKHYNNGYNSNHYFKNALSQV